MHKVSRNGFEFSWDEDKARANSSKHGVGFEEAATVFDDPHAVRSYDLDHSQDEDRFLMVGMSARLKLLFVCHRYRESAKSIRIISARKADAQETQAYQRQRHDA